MLRIQLLIGLMTGCIIPSSMMAQIPLPVEAQNLKPVMVYLKMEANGNLTADYSVIKQIQVTRYRLVIDSNGKQKSVPYVAIGNVEEHQTIIILASKYSPHHINGKKIDTKIFTAMFKKKEKIPALIIQGDAGISRRERPFYSNKLVVIYKK